MVLVRPGKPGGGTGMPRLPGARDRRETRTSGRRLRGTLTDGAAETLCTPTLAAPGTPRVCGAVRTRPRKPPAGKHSGVHSNGAQWGPPILSGKKLRNASSPEEPLGTHAHPDTFGRGTFTFYVWHNRVFEKGRRPEAKTRDTTGAARG